MVRMKRRLVRTQRYAAAAASTLGLAFAGLVGATAPAHANNPLYDCSYSGGNTINLYGQTAGPGGFGSIGSGGCVLTSKTELIMQTDGNLVLYCVSWDAWGDPSLGSPIWDTKTYGQGYGGGSDNYAKFQDDGNFVVYDVAGSALWSSRTWGNNGAHLAVQDDSNVVIYRADGTPIWHTNTWNAC